MLQDGSLRPKATAVFQSTGLRAVDSILISDCPTSFETLPTSRCENSFRGRRTASIWSADAMAYVWA